jgi:fumarate hydratase subunit alpha
MEAVYSLFTQIYAYYNRCGETVKRGENGYRYDGRGEMISREQIESRTAEAIARAGVFLPDDVRAALLGAYEREAPDSIARNVLTMVSENLAAAEESLMPMCQDTGMTVVFADIGTEAPVRLGDIDPAINAAVAASYTAGSFRKSVVSDPVFDRENTGTNKPAVIWHTLTEGNTLTLHIMLKGFGCENCSALEMLNPTAGPEGVIEAVTRIVRQAGGKPCPPIVVGVGIGGTAERAMVLSKRAQLRPLDDRHPDSRFAQLEDELLTAVNGTETGPGGLGGKVTALAVKIAAEPTHIAGLPVGVSISCWADRHLTIVLTDDEEAQ